MIQAIGADLRVAIRAMRRSPGFTAAALVMIALGTAANAAIFSVVDAVMLRSPFAEPDRVAIVRAVRSNGQATAAISLAQYRSLVQSAPVFEAVAATGVGTRPILTTLADPRRLNLECVTATMFRVLGTQPATGRAFTADEDRPGGPGVMLISHRFWQRELGGGAGAVGTVLTLNGAPVTIVGIMPPRFAGPYSRNGIDGWMPLGPSLGGQPTAGCGLLRGGVNAFVRVTPGVTLDAAGSAATGSAGIGRIADSDGNTGASLSLEGITEHTVADLRMPLFALAGAVGLVLLIACFNVANLQLERLFSRREELSVRMALGATRARLVQQTLTENLLLFGGGLCLGIVVTYWAVGLVVDLIPAYVPHIQDIAINGRVLAATVALVGLSGLAVGSVPAIQGTRSELAHGLRLAGRTTTRGGAWTRRVLVVGQVALSMTLLVGAVLMIRTFLTLRPTEPGFAAADKLISTFRLQGTAARAPEPFFTTLLERVRAMPGVRSVSASSHLPMSGLINVATVVARGTTANVFSGSVTTNYFEDMQIPLAAGRGFSARDDGAALQVAIVNQAFVRRMFAGTNPIGEAIEVRSFDGQRVVRQVVGVIRDTRSAGMDLRARAEIYLPLAQSPTPFLNLIVRTADPRDPRLAVAIRAAIAAIDPAQLPDRVVPLSEILDASVAPPRFGAWLLGVFAGLAVLLAAVGLAACMAWWVSQRTREIGLRMALGADAPEVTRMFFAQGMLLTGVGIVLGLGGAALSTRLIESWLYGVTPLDPATFGASALALLTIAACASYLPARRAALVDPLLALRAE